MNLKIGVVTETSASPSDFLKVEEEVIRQQETRKGTTSKSEVQDMAISILRLKCVSYTVSLL